MNLLQQLAARWLRRIPVLAALLFLPFAARGQSSIVYGQFPITGGTTFTYDANGERVWSPVPDFPQSANLMINGQMAFTFYSGVVFSIRPASSNAVIAAQPYVPSSLTALAVPLQAGVSIGPEAAGYGWLPNIYTGEVLTSARDSHTIGEPPLTDGYFTGIESAYIGLQFQDKGQTYYGWARAGAPVVGINGGWIYDYAYETIPGKLILAGAVPQAAMTVPTLARPNQIRLTWQTQIGKTYQVQFNETLQSSFPGWANLDFAVVATTTNASVEVPIVGAARFYRAIEIP